MRRSTSFSGTHSLLKSCFAGALGLATILSCSDSTAPAAKTNRDPALDGISVVVMQVADSLKHASAAASSSMGSSAPAIVRNITSAPTASASVAAPSATYTVSSIGFDPEPAPANFLLACDDCVAYDTPIGFDFTFYGNTYSKVHVASNGVVGFSRSIGDGCCQGGGMPVGNDAPYNNMIAVAWTDLNSGALNADVRYQTQGTAPNRKFVVQWNNVPEYFNGPGRVTAQLVLSEGSNDITINTVSNTIVTNQYHPVTQGIENADGSEAAFVAGRVRAFFALSSDAVRFSLPRVRVNTPPVLTAPANISTTTAPPALASSRVAFSQSTHVGSCFANVDPGAASATDDVDGVSITSARSDGAALDAAYPKGITTITWTATDADGVAASATQTVTVSDKESPLVTAPAAISARTDRGKVTATVAAGNATVDDNCEPVKVDGVRSDGALLSAPFSIGTTTITWTATDESGNVGSANQSIEVHGNLPPVITAPASFAVNTDATVCSAMANAGVATVVDDDEGSTVEGRRSDGALLNAAYPKGTTSITWTAKDADGASAEANQTVTVNDGEKPAIAAPADRTSRTAPGHNWAMVAVGNASGQDNCVNVTVNGSRSDGAALDAAYQVGSTTIVWTARDLAGNSASAAQKITVNDEEAPVISVPASMRVNATSAGGALVSYAVSTSDNVGAPNASCVPASGSLFPMGPTTVRCSVADAAGNRTEKSFDVVVVGPEDQILSLIEYIQGQHLPNGTANPLVNQLRAAFRSDDSQACKKMEDFLGMVQKKGSGLSMIQSSYMNREAGRIMDAMGCS